RERHGGRLESAALLAARRNAEPKSSDRERAVEPRRLETWRTGGPGRDAPVAKERGDRAAANGDRRLDRIVRHDGPAREPCEPQAAAPLQLLRRARCGGPPGYGRRASRGRDGAARRAVGAPAPLRSRNSLGPRQRRP